MSFATVIENSPCVRLVSNNSVGACRAPKVTLDHIGAGKWSVRANVRRLAPGLDFHSSPFRKVHGHFRVARPHLKVPAPITPAFVPDDRSASIDLRRFPLSIIDINSHQVGEPDLTSRCFPP